MKPIVKVPKGLEKNLENIKAALKEDSEPKAVRSHLDKNCNEYRQDMPVARKKTLDELDGNYE